MTEPRPKHFASVTDAMISDRTPKSTKDATRNWVRIFEEFLKMSDVVLDSMYWTKEEFVWHFPIVTLVCGLKLEELAV